MPATHLTSRKLGRMSSRRRMAFALALAFGGLSQTRAEDNIAWVDWYQKTSTGVLGTIMLGEEQVDVTFSGPYFHAFTDLFVEPL